MKPKIYKLTNGLRILFCPQKESLSTTVLILVNTGTDYETKKINGISHFIEHLYFKGSQKYPNPKILLENIDKIGANWNAFTGYEYTGFYLKVLPEHIEKALDILSDIILNPLFPAEEIEKERKVIIEEINMINDDPKRLIYFLGMNLVFGDQPAGWPVTGTKENILRIQRKDILNYVKTNYSSKNTLIVIAGKISQEKRIVKFIEERFKKYNSKPVKKSIVFKKPPEKIEERIYYKPELNQVHIFLGFSLDGFLKLKDTRYQLMVASNVLGGKASSRLHMKIREELGGAYYIGSGFIDYPNRSIFYVKAGLDLERLEFLLKNIIDEIKYLKENNLTKEELETSKTVIKSHLLLDLEDTLSLAEFYGITYLLENKIVAPQELESKIEKINLDSIKRTLDKYFHLKNLRLAVMLPDHFKNKKLKILKKILK